MVEIDKFILWICEVPRRPYEIMAELEKERKGIAYPNLMTRLGVLEAMGKIRKVKRMDKKIVYQTISMDIPMEEVKE